LSKLGEKAEFVLPLQEKNKKHVYHLFVIRCRQREKLIELLEEKNISWGIHYPNALPFIDIFGYKKHKPQDFLISGNIINDIISIPIYPELTEPQLNIICEQLLKFNE
jgi:dTDP-4-amino-4,6-dideoxygalactose transaminase